MIGGADIDMRSESVSGGLGEISGFSQYNDGFSYKSSPWDAEGLTGTIASVYRLGPKRVASEVGALSEILGVDAPDEDQIMAIYNEQIYVEGKPKQSSMAEALENLGLLDKEILSSDTELYKALIEDLLLVPEVGPVATRREIKGLKEYAPVPLGDDFNYRGYIDGSYQVILGGEKRTQPRPADTIIGVYRDHGLIDSVGPPKPMPADAERAYV